MPTISFSLKDLSKLVGKKLSAKDVENLIEFAKGEIDCIENDVVTASMGDTNRPDLWSVEGVARLFKGVLNIETGFKKLKAKKSKDSLIVDKNLKVIRPYIAAFSVKGCKVSEEFLKQLIQLQEKLCHSFG